MTEHTEPSHADGQGVNGQQVQGQVSEPGRTEPQGSESRRAVDRFDGLLFDAGGVFLLPDADVLGPLLAYYGGDPSYDAHRRAHHAAMAAKSRAGHSETEWGVYSTTYVDAIGVPAHERDEAAAVFDRTRNAWVWRKMIPESRTALAALAATGIPIGVVSNASGQIESVLAREVCQVGDGPNVSVRCVIDSEVVGVEKPDPRIFEPALAHFGGIDRQRIAYIGDSVVMDIGGARAAGLHPILLDPFDHHADFPGADDPAGGGFERITSLADLL